MDRLILSVYNNLLRIPLSESPTIDLEGEEEVISVSRAIPETIQLEEGNPEFIEYQPPIQNIATYRLHDTIGYKPRVSQRRTSKVSLNNFVGEKMARIFKHNAIQMGPDVDKLFSSAWLNDEMVIVGSKNNTLHLVNTFDGQKIQLPTPSRQNVLTFDQNGNLSHKNGVMPNEDEIRDSQICGYHSIEISPNNRFLATTSELPTDICIYNKNTMEPMYNITAHDDWIFDMKFLTDEFLISGSRNEKLGIWKLREDGKLIHGVSIKTLNLIRQIQIDQKNRIIYTCSNTGTISKFDLNHSQQAINRYNLPITNETVTMALQNDTPLMAIGGRSDLMIFDMRMKDKKVKCLENKQQSWGLRSLSWHGNILTCCGGLGRVSFYDLRANNFIPIIGTMPSRDNIYYSISGGHVRRDETYYAVFDVLGITIPTAVYSHCYSPNRSKIFLAGGPTQYGLYGSYSGILHL